VSSQEAVTAVTEWMLCVMEEEYAIPANADLVVLAALGQQSEARRNDVDQAPFGQAREAFGPHWVLMLLSVTQSLTACLVWVVTPAAASKYCYLPALQWLWRQLLCSIH